MSEYRESRGNVVLASFFSEAGSIVNPASRLHRKQSHPLGGGGSTVSVNGWRKLRDRGWMVADSRVCGQV